MTYRFYRTPRSSPPDAAARSEQRPEAKGSYRTEWWQPTITSWRPSGLEGKAFLVWWLFHHARVFANRGYRLYLLRDGERLIHRSCVFPGFFRFPFMNGSDLQVGDTWTDPSYRGQGLATRALADVVAAVRPSATTLWYVVSEDNRSSIRVAENAGLVLAGLGERRKRCGLGILGQYVLTQPRSDSE